MLKIKLSRTGKTHQPSYRIVVVEAKSKRDGKYVENLGHYNPVTKDFVVDTAKYGTWLTKGAQPTLTVANLLKKHTNEKSA
ncbi:30S ribosomal protein S16 [Candidatus Cerribacteria bacterium 'Amazon FNV 2010 28 9']|uniref:Small ribosomal subunit protein bS16 n=1 Tax=Candidatus Cerribacteria bacterium 'Amazon FNV 2010 28 9' TaxID=2081795 RepID=A0A317JQG7_9BACT|nr:MAG: 30S ribosomal protein S16 [Candidatus Cerribacteria bacterium 'Amazon FNV 2010 28 9']